MNKIYYIITPSLSSFSIFIAEGRRPWNNAPVLSSSSYLLLLSCTPPESCRSCLLYRLPVAYCTIHISHVIPHNAFILVIMMAANAYARNAIIFCRRSSFYRMPSARNSTKLCHMFGSEPDLKNRRLKFGVLPLKCGTPKLPIFRWFYDDIATQARYLSSKTSC